MHPSQRLIFVSLLALSGCQIENSLGDSLPAAATTTPRKLDNPINTT